MKSNRFYLLMILLGVCTFAMAQKAITQDGNTFTIQSGKCTMVIDGQKGSKVISLKCGDQELISQHKPRTEHMRFENPNDFGSTFWPSPQSEWNWPPIATYDSAPYSATCGKEELTLTSNTDAKYPYVFVKTFKPLGKGDFLITYTIKNVSSQDVKVAPWEITRVPSGGYLFFDAPAIEPATEMTYTSEIGLQWIKFIAKERQNRKIFADAKGWLAFANDGLFFVKQFENITSADAAPGEEEVEIYFNAGNTYTEIENQGKYVNLKPQESTSWQVKWTLQNVDKNANKTTLKTAVQDILKK